MKRKEFITRSGLAAASLALLPGSPLFTANTGKQVRIAIIGVGLRGQDHLELLLMRNDVYDAAAWSTITPLSEQSIALGNETLNFRTLRGANGCTESRYLH